MLFIVKKVGKYLNLENAHEFFLNIFVTLNVYLYSVNIAGNLYHLMLLQIVH